MSVAAFADGEARVRIEADVRARDVWVVQPTSAPTNERLLRLALADAAHAEGAASVGETAPLFAAALR